MNKQKKKEKNWAEIVLGELIADGNRKYTGDI